MHLSVFLFLFISSVTCSPALKPSAVDTESSSRIVNGFAIDINDIPYQAVLRRKVFSGWAHTCGAVVVSDRAVLTAAHCVDLYESEPSSLRVVVGTSSRLSGGKSYDVARVIVHEYYSSITLVNDIGILVLSKKMSFGQSVQPVSYAHSDSNLPEGTEALVSGYGSIAYENSASDVLLAAYVKIIAQNTCARAYLQIAAITTGMICANATNPPRDACQGDSGGPLVAGNTLVGIVSWGEGCADKSYPGVYTRVSEYYYWITTLLSSI